MPTDPVSVIAGRMSPRAAGVLVESIRSLALDHPVNLRLYVGATLAQRRAAPGGPDLVSGLSFIGADPADCATDYDLDLTTTKPRAVLVSDGYTPARAA